MFVNSLCFIVCGASALPALIDISSMYDQCLVVPQSEGCRKDHRRCSPGHTCRSITHDIASARPKPASTDSAASSAYALHQFTLDQHNTPQMSQYDLLIISENFACRSLTSSSKPSFSVDFLSTDRRICQLFDRDNSSNAMRCVA